MADREGKRWFVSADRAPRGLAVRLAVSLLVLSAALLIFALRPTALSGAEAASGARPQSALPGHPALLQTDPTQNTDAAALASADTVTSSAHTSTPTHLSWPNMPLAGGTPEARLLEVYKLIGQERLDAAIVKARALTQDVPNFQLAHLTYADLLSARHGSLNGFGNAAAGVSAEEAERLDQLRQEAAKRLLALQDLPPSGKVPSQFLELPASIKHAIAVDASHSRLYLFRNERGGLKLVNHFYVSVGRLGVQKSVEGDQRTPLGVYFITSRLSAGQLKDFYGVGALPLNYPNEYDRRMGKTGSGIWLHGVPSESYSRSPQSTDGCVVLSNQDLATLLSEITPRATPVVIADHLDWVAPSALIQDRDRVLNLLKGWSQARDAGDVRRTLSFYSTQFSNGSADFSQWAANLERDLARSRNTSAELKDVSILRWQDRSEILVLTFAELRSGSRTGHVKRQYWGKENGLWKIFYEGVLG